ncbi:ATP-dependent Clp protease ATP-binding subunit, partial [Candidatus Roizmanbacteria bacterium]|nr:ATP-dependent Clp protease ATP-binding subunit [Candidatus Roizmanbacteria bacterium]
GVGKTETAKVLAEIFFKDSKHLIRFDMSLYQSKEDIGNLIGSIIYNNPGLLTQAVRDKPYAVLLLDEIEKANKDLLNIFLTILDEGYFKDGLGKNVDCKNLAIIATSNAGSDFIYKNLGNSNLQRTLIDYLIEKDHFSPEFLNRFDGVIAFNSLSKEAVLAIAKKMVEKLSQNYQKSHNVSISIADQTIAEIVNESFSSQFGARNLERVILSKVQDIVNKRILEGNIRSGEVISV